MKNKEFIRNPLYPIMYGIKKARHIASACRSLDLSGGDGMFILSFQEKTWNEKLLQDLCEYAAHLLFLISLNGFCRITSVITWIF